MLKYLLDTNIAICVIKRRPVEALAQFNHHAGQLVLSAISQAELIHGVGKKLDAQTQFACYGRFLLPSDCIRLRIESGWALSRNSCKA